MTVAAQNPVSQIAAAAGQTVFPFAWRCDDASTVKVYVDDAPVGGYGVALNVDQVGAPGGTITLPAPLLGTEVVTVERVSPQTQTTAYTKYGPFSAPTISAALDKILMLAQEVSAKLGRSLLAARSNYSKFSSLELPAPQDGSMIAFVADPVAIGKFKFGTALSASKEYVDNVIQAILGGGNTVAPTKWVVVGDDINTNYAIPGAPFASPDLYYVTVGGVLQEPTTDYSMDITVVPALIKFTGVVPLNARVVVRALGYAKAVNAAIAGPIVAAYGAVVTLDAGAGESQILPVVNGVAFALAVPLNATSGRKLRVRFKNSSGGAMGVVTPNAIFKMPAFVAPANNFSRVYEWEYNGVNWVETFRSTADIPN